MQTVQIRFGEKVKNLRLQRGLSQEKLAHLAKIDRTYLPSIENGTRNVSIGIIERLAGAFNLKMSDLIKGID